MRLFSSMFLLVLFPLTSLSAQLTEDSLAGKWIFTHMILDGESERSVNRIMAFLPDGNIVNYDKSGKKESRASYAVEPNAIIYSDERGDQTWKVKTYDGNNLHVNHLGADMFFEKQ